MAVFFSIFMSGVAVAETTTVSRPEASSTSPDVIGNIAQVSLGLVAVLVLIFVFAWLLKRVPILQGGTASVLQIVGTLSVGPRERVVLIQVGEEQLVVGVAPGRVETLHIMEKPVMQTTVKSMPTGGTFSEKLQAALSQRLQS